MKKIYLFFASVFSVLLLNSCAKEAGGREAALEEQTVTFWAQSPDGVAVKTVLGDETGHKSISWAENDSVKIFYGTTATAYKEAGIGENGEINIKIAAATYKNFFGIYPTAASGKMVNSTTCTGSVIVPQLQSGAFDDACLMVGWATDERILRFHTAVSMITIDVEDPEISQIVIRANDGTPIAGQAEFSFDKTTGEITKIVHSNTSPEVTLAVNGPGKYYVGLLPDVELKAGIGFKLVKGAKESGALSRTPLNLKRTELMSIGKVEDKVLPEGDIFIKAGGLGKGTSWSDAGGVSLLNTLLDVQVSESVRFDGVTTSWKLAGKKIYIAEGTYNLTGADNLPFSIACGKGKLDVYGGYSEGSIGTDVSKYSPSTYVTVFTADQGVRIMNANGLAGGKLDVRGITFSGANTSCDGAAVAVESSSDFNIEFTDCTFDNNTTAKNGAGLYVTGGNVRLNNCTLTKNMGITAIASDKTETDDYHYNTSHGGAIFANGKDARLYIRNCMFRNNLAFVGADIELWYGANAYVYDCAFISGVAQAPNYYGIYPGRSINVDAMKNGTIGQLCMCNCTLTKTSSVYSANGGLPVIAPTNYFCMLVNCTLHDGAVASLRNNNNTDRTATNPDLIWLVANLFVNSSNNAINLHSSSNRHGFYNMLEKGKNSYAELDPTDTKIAESEFTSLKFASEKGYYSWTVDETLNPVNRPTKAHVEDVVTTNCPDFNTWLYTLSDNPYGYDQIGTVRNPGAICPGSWDKGI